MENKVRRTQEERSASMRQRLLDATIDCLVTYGYAGTTTSKVAELAGVTRGAQVHHFPTKADLVTAAVRHLAIKRAEFAHTQLDRLRAADDMVGAALDLLWEAHQGPIFTATVELWVASRSDEELREQVSTMESLAASSFAEFDRDVFPEFPGHPRVRHFFYTAMDTMRGILLNGFVLTDDEVIDQRWRRARAHLRTLAQGILDELTAEQSSSR
ncbi:Transcriptional regulator, TetR family [Alloactinosynnema sp. L-07]|uniref:TetR/AcrR family transcriptional regulator n=1 Tax=Alloactinosynnema sp. L-07 TaxID=1653480 RepID=UPI00065F0ABB|nr:TetR/AcrR family transcriptional regulator [Alloactinosynnema sp. L-07]CRK56468.1 Transcriptional regulator, TetR family [Alloactinosynnema sp. L-07]